MGLEDTKSDLNCKRLIYGLEGIPEDTLLSDAMKIFETGDFTPDDTLRWNFDVPNDVSSPRDMVKIFSLIHDGKIVSKDACRQMIDIMLECQTNSRIPYHIPQTQENGVKIYHKTGTLDDVACDCGVIQSPTQDFCLVMFYDGYKSSDAEKAVRHGNDLLLAGLAREIFAAVHEA
jgi:beta-lactamase class A